MENDSVRFALELHAIRNGDRTAVERFVAEYEPYIRRTIRIRLARSNLKQAADSIDLCQSVLGSFLIRLSAGEYEIATEGALRKLLYAIANNKFLALQRHELATKRDRRSTLSIHSQREPVDERQAKPDRILSQIELMAEFQSKLTSDELLLYQLRKHGATWNEIASQQGEDAIVLRKRLSRAIRRVSNELGLEEGDS
jgi:DNA-directed RNA polymerase specialized sigma24 family protein